MYWYRKTFPRLRAGALAAGWVAAAAVVSAAEITVADLQKQLVRDDKLTVIDVRSPAFFGRSHIPNAINVPGSLWTEKSLPPLGRVVVYDGGLGTELPDFAASALAGKPGLKVDVLQGGFAAWESARAATTAPRGLAAESLNYITYAQLKSTKAGEAMLVDLRKPAAADGVPKGADTPPVRAKTDLAAKFPGLAQTPTPFDPAKKAPSASGGPAVAPVLVLIDDGDGTAQAMARKLKANSIKRYVILAGGELILSRHGQPGLQRAGAGARLLGPNASAGNTNR